MTIYAGLDVSDKHVLSLTKGPRISVWLIVRAQLPAVSFDGLRMIGLVASDPEVLAKWLNKHCKGLVRVVLETGPLSTFLYHGLAEREVPVICICARHAKKALSARINKSDVNDAESLAQLCRTGWFKAVHMKVGATHIDKKSAPS